MDKIKTANVLLIILMVMVGVCIFANREKLFGSSKVAGVTTDSTATPADATV